MKLNAFEAGEYDDEHVVIRNPANNKQELFTLEEFGIIQFLQKNQNETLLALLMPNIGIAKKQHVLICLKVLTKLRRIQVVDHFSITGKKMQSDTATLEMDVKREVIKLAGLDAFAAAMFGLFASAFAWMGTMPFMLLMFLLAATSFLLFPLEKLELTVMNQGFEYFSFFVVLYVVATLAFSFRALVQATYLKGLGRGISGPRVVVYFPFLSLGADTSQVNLEGFRARLQLALLGLMSPLAFSFLFSALAALGILNVVVAYAALCACVAVTLILACPVFGYDLAALLHVMLNRRELEESVSKNLKHIFQTKGSLSQPMLIALLCTLVWFLAWLDSFRMFWEPIATKMIDDFLTSDSLKVKIGAGLLAMVSLVAILLPGMIFVWSFIRERVNPTQKVLRIAKEKVKDSLTFEERMSALEKIPLFASLNDQERLSLLNEMALAFYKSNDFLVHQGEIGREFFVLVKGEARVYFTDMKGKQIELAELREGDAFGEIALLDDVPRMASVVSQGGCLVLVLKKDGFDRFTESLGSPERVKSMIRITSFFRRHPLFSRLTAKDQANLIDSFAFNTITAGEEVVDSEDQEAFHLIYSGKIRVDTGDDATETFLGADDCFGYANPLGVRYFAAEGTGLLSVKKQQFDTLIWEKLVSRSDLFV